MKENMVILWLEGEGDPKEVDWVKIAADNGFVVTGERIKSFPWQDVYHEVTWWITRPMTLKEWIALDDAESKAIYKIVGDNYMGTAGPIPEIGYDTTRTSEGPN